MECRQIRVIYLLFLLLLTSDLLSAKNPDPNIKYEIFSLEDKSGEWNINDVQKKHFKPVIGHTPNYGLTSSTYWLKIRLSNLSNERHFLVKIHNGTLTNVDFFSFKNNVVQIQSASDTQAYDLRRHNTQYPLFYIGIPPDSTIICFLKISSINVLDLPISVDVNAKVLSNISLDQLYFGIYAGIILIMFLYNIFIYFTVKDKNYLYYVLYIIVVGLLQACLKGYAAKFLWPNNPWLIQQAPNLFIALSGIFAMPFVINFLQVKKRAVKFFYVLLTLTIIYVVGIIFNLNKDYIIAQQLLQLNAGIVSITIIACGIYIYRNGYRPALFLTVSWSFFLSGVIIYILKDTGILPFNNFTNNAILIGSGVEVALLSFALADKINILKKEKEASQAAALQAAQENERLIREQNVVLEAKVQERTMELIAANEELSVTLEELKDTQAQLVESEKMSSLGQLTAGIAHEINNPINFVTSNVAPLRRDVDILLESASLFENIGLSEIPADEKKQQIDEHKDEIDYDYLKEEINHLLNGIHEGASRTAEIVKGLRIFSRVDEDDLKKADINEGLDSTLVIINNLLDNKIKVIKKYGNLPLIECYPGKLNQVFLNIITNGIHAVKQRHGNENTGWLKITTSADEEKVYVKIEDNGTGMDEHVMKKIFEPFFTTKEVGEGTGLGMSITYNTIKKHNAEIHVRSAPGEGTEFILELPVIQPTIGSDDKLA